MSTSNPSDEIVLIKNNQEMSTFCVKLPLLELSLIHDKGSVAGKLQHSTD